MIASVAQPANSISPVYRASEETAAARRPDGPGRDLGPAWLTALVTVMLLAVGLRIGFAVEPQRPQEPDSIGYARIAKSLYEHGSFEEGGFRTHTQEPSNYSPGLPLFVAGLYFVTGGVHLELARIVLALIGSLAVLFAFAIGSRLAGPAAGIVAGLVVAVYPALLQYQGMLMTEPLAVTLLAAALLAFLWAGDRGRPPWAWALPGLLLGLMAMVRPEYLLFGLLAVPLALLRAGRRQGGWGQGALAALLLGLALLLPIVPWTVRNAVVLDRFVPISTGGGKALYVGTYLPADGDGPRLREQLLAAHPALARRVDRLALSNRLDTLLAVLAARQHPGLDTDAALMKMGRENIHHYASDRPNDFGAMLARKAYRAWREGPRSVMHSTLWKGFQKVLALFGLLGLGVLAFRRRWEALPLALLVLTTTATSALLIASPRRVLVILPAVAALAGAGIVWLGERARALRT
jgi:4-amino-4-deoxy-L-arabinose transferase-like glycosyltransferase